ncbi:MAG: flippase-like domain-containing protein [Deltaproteobacteria bacterium]|nr:MAG: flippase-like domain-containing protein [Deltaproteobacteria bacterium]
MKRLWVRAVLGLCLGGAAATAVSLYLGISHRDLFAELHDVRSEPLVLAALGSMILLGLQSLRWWIVMRPVLPLTYPQAFKAMVVGFCGNVLLPARGGDLLRVQYLGRRTGVSRAKLLGTEIVDFWSDKWGWIAAFPVICLLGDPPAWLTRALLLMGAVVVLVSAVLVVMASGLWRGRTAPAFLNNLREGFAANRWRRLLLVETAISPLPWLWETFVIALAGHALGLSLTPMQAFATLTAFNIATAVPSPGNAGSFEAGGTLALVAFGVDKGLALAFIFLYHLTQVVPGFLGGILILVVDGELLFGKRRAEPLATRLLETPAVDPG